MSRQLAAVQAEACCALLQTCRASSLAGGWPSKSAPTALASQYASIAYTDGVLRKAGAGCRGSHRACHLLHDILTRLLLTSSRPRIAACLQFHFRQLLPDRTICRDRPMVDRGPTSLCHKRSKRQAQASQSSSAGSCRTCKGQVSICGLSTSQSLFPLMAHTHACTHSLSCCKPLLPACFRVHSSQAHQQNNIVHSCPPFGSPCGRVLQSFLSMHGNAHTSARSCRLACGWLRMAATRGCRLHAAGQLPRRRRSHPREWWVRAGGLPPHPREHTTGRSR